MVAPSYERASILYTMKVGKWYVGSKKLKKSQEYPIMFCRRLVQAWKAIEETKAAAADGSLYSWKDTPASLPLVLSKSSVDQRKQARLCFASRGALQD